MRFAVVGAGIAGLVAAYRLRTLLGADADITVVESSARVGGTLRTVDFAGGALDVGAEAFVGRRPEVPALLDELGLAQQLVHPSGLRPLLWADAGLHPLPERTLMGIPSAAESVAAIVDSGTLRRIRDEPARPLHWTPGSDASVHELVAERFGEQVVHRSVDPLLGGVYAGASRGIGVRAALPTLAAALDAGAPSLTEAVQRALPPPQAGPVFGAVRDGYGALVDALVRHAAADVRTGAEVTSVTPAGSGWAVEPIGRFDGLVLAVPAPVATRLLGPIAPDAAEAAARIEVSTSALVVLELPAAALLPQNSGILVATDESLRAKAFTLSSRKWPHLAERESAIARASFGRFGDAGIVETPDADLIEIAAADLSAITGAEFSPTDAMVQRWRGGLPQYAPGHTDRVTAIEQAVAGLPGLEVAGAYLHGVGVPACVASGDGAARRLAGLARTA